MNNAIQERRSFCFPSTKKLLNDSREKPSLIRKWNPMQKKIIAHKPVRAAAIDPQTMSPAEKYAST